MFVLAGFFWNRIISFSSPWIAAQYSAYSQIASFEQTVLLERFYRVLGTGWLVTTGRRQKRGYAALVKPDQKYKRSDKYLFQIQNSAVKKNDETVKLHHDLLVYRECRSFFTVFEVNSKIGKLIPNLVGQCKILIGSCFVSHSNKHIDDIV